ASLSHPGENVTGLSLTTADLMAKRLQLLKEAIPQATRAAVLWHPATPFHAKAGQDLKAAAPALSLRLRFVPMRAPEDLNSAFSAINRAHPQAPLCHGRRHLQGAPSDDPGSRLQGSAADDLWRERCCRRGRTVVLRSEPRRHVSPISRVRRQ